jgi:FlgD Ig-like domain
MLRPAALKAVALAWALLPFASLPDLARAEHPAAPGGAPLRVVGEVTPIEPLRSSRLDSRSARAYSTADTISVFIDSLETYSSPSNEGRWTHVDESGTPTAWNISTLYGCGNHAFWCGIVDSSWTGDPNRRGYANNWVQWLENYADLSGAASPYTISFKNRMNVEAGYDYGRVEVLDADDFWLPIATYTGVVNDGGPTLCNVSTATIPDSVVAKLTPTHFRFRFTSDIQNSSQDGLYPSGEGWAIDDVTVKGGVSDVRFFDDMESGMGTWTRSIFPPTGDYWKIVANPVTQEICTANTSKVWQVNDNLGGLTPALDDKLISPSIAVNGAAQVFLFFDVYRDLPFDGCFYYGLSLRTRKVGASWSPWLDPSGLLYYGVEREWLRQTVPLVGAGGADSIQFRIGVKDYGPIYCGGSQTSAGTVYFDNFRVGVLGSAGPSITASESNLFNDTFRTTAFFGNDNFNTPLGDSVVVQIAAASGVKSASLQYSLNNAAFTSLALTRVGTSSKYYGDIPAGGYARGTELRYYFSATDSLNQVVTLPVDAVAAGHYYKATVLPKIFTSSAGCPDDTARILYVNAFAGPDAQTGTDTGLTAIGARYDRFDINSAGSALGNSPGGGDPADPAHAWPAVPLATLGIYKTILWDVGERSSGTLSSQDQTLLQSWAGLTGKNRGLLLVGDNIARDLAANGQGIPNFLTCTLGATYYRDVWENAPQDSLQPTLMGASGTRINLEAFPLDGACPSINSFDALFVASCVGANGRVWIRYPNTLAAATERLGALGSPGGDSLRVILLGFSLQSMSSASRRNYLLYRTVVDEFETPSCYTATGLDASGAPRLRGPRLDPAAPNPFNPRTVIRFGLDRGGRVQLRIFSVQGSLVRTLADRPYSAGEYGLAWDGRDDRGLDVGSGAYFVRLEVDGARVPARKVILLR